MRTVEISSGLAMALDLAGVSPGFCETAIAKALEDVPEASCWLQLSDVYDLHRELCWLVDHARYDAESCRLDYVTEWFRIIEGILDDWWTVDTVSTRPVRETSLGWFPDEVRERFPTVDPAWFLIIMRVRTREFVYAFKAIMEVFEVRRGEDTGHAISEACDMLGAILRPDILDADMDDLRGELDIVERVEALFGENSMLSGSTAPPSPNMSGEPSRRVGFTATGALVHIIDDDRSSTASGLRSVCGRVVTRLGSSDASQDVCTRCESNAELGG